MGDILLKQMSRKEARAFDLPEDLTILEWVERRMYLPSRAEESGVVRIDRTPYVRPWLEAAVADDVEEIVICASAQVAKTTYGLAVAGFYADVMGAPVLICLSDEATAKHVQRDRVRKMFEESPELYHLISGATVSNADEIELANGGYIAAAWASSVSALATREFRVTIGDEIDKPGYSVKTTEASALSLIRERTESFFKFKNIFFSTPSLESGNVSVELKSCDAIFDWHVPCPHCGMYQPLRFSPEHAYGFKKGLYLDREGEPRTLGRIVWEGGRHATDDQIMGARYQCGSCEKLWTTAMKNRAVINGEAVARKPVAGKIRKMGFHVNRLYSLLGKSGYLDRIVKRFVDALGKSNPRVLQGFMNSTLAEPYLPSKKIRKTETLMRLRDDRPRGIVPPKDVACLVAGVDTQDDGFFFEIRAFTYGMDKTSWSVREGKVPTFEALDQVLWKDQYRDIKGNVYQVRLAVHDAMGHRASEVYDFSRLRRGMVLPSQGVQTMRSPFRYSEIGHYPGSKKIIPGGLTIVRFDTNYYKNMLSGLLEIVGGDPGSFNYHSEITEEWCRQMTVEFINEKNLWECPDGKDNHAWDCSVLTLLAHDILGVSFWPDPRVARLETKETKKKKKSGGRGSRW